MKKIWDDYKYIIISVLLTIFALLSFYFIGYYVGRKVGRKECKVIYSPPVEKNVIDTLYITRDRIINKIQYLETIKYDTIEKIYILDDSSSVELFYKLVSE